MFEESLGWQPQQLRKINQTNTQLKSQKRRLAAKRILPLIVLKIDSFLVLLALLKWAADGPLCFGRDVLTQQLTFTRAAKEQEFMFDLCSNRIWKEDQIGKK